MELNKGKCQFLYLRRNNLIRQCKQGADHLKRSFADTLGVLVDHS